MKSHSLKFKIVELTWLDCYSDDGAKFDPGDFKVKPDKYLCRRKVVGYLSDEDDYYYYLGGDMTIQFDFDEDNEDGKIFHGLTAVPKGCVEKKRILR